MLLTSVHGRNEVMPEVSRVNFGATGWDTGERVR